jgi:anti-sigma B factor antagonist
MRFKTKEVNGVTVIELKGNIMGGPDSIKLRETLHKLLDKGKKKVVVDVGNVKFMNSSGLGILISALTTMRNGGGDLKIARPTEKIESLLIITKLIKIFETYNSVEEAVESYNKPPSRRKK